MTQSILVFRAPVNAGTTNHPRVSRLTQIASHLTCDGGLSDGQRSSSAADVSFGAANWLAPVVGIQEKFGAARACVAAGLSTSIGFMANMVVQAAALPAKACWIDADYANPRDA